ncbi:hypothetical protein [Thermanaeromonas sp.]|nr:hypothetical protein [Thermanaeromonas sp.]
MQKRICPGCGLPWWSAAAGTVWKCPNCGAEIPVPEETDEKLSGR